jgi:GTP-binding protein EngB required for normal cell division/thioredoxin-like negative regulator of GroEL
MSVFDRALERAARFLDEVGLLPDALRVELEEAERELAAGEHVAAAETFRRLLDARPGLLRAQVGYARALAARGALGEATAVVAEARQGAPDDPVLALLAARLALAADDTGRAITLSREAGRRLAQAGGPLFAEACSLRARAELVRGRPDRAARELRKAVAAAPDDVEHKIALVESLGRLGDATAAGRVARAIPESALSPEGSARLALALRVAGDTRAYSDLLERAGKAGHTGALVALAEDALVRRELAAAEAHARTAIARGGGAPALEVLARALAAGDKSLEAADALLAAADGTASAAEARAIEERAAELVPLDLPGADGPRQLTRFADRLEARGGSPLARAIRAHALVALGEHEAASALVTGDELPPRALLARARIALLAPGREPDALLALDALLGRPISSGDAALASTLRRRALRALYHRGGELDLPAALDHVRALGESERLAELATGARELRDELDRPLLLAILGEFNAGKSTLVNAFVGAEVAPTGILPTTATLNLLRGGAERRVRVVRKDGTTREGGYEEARALLEAASAEGHAVDHVEIVLPSELLERVWILDTPGSNAPDPDHERLAREAMRRADAALWIFDAGQAGKATEGSVLAAVRRSRREVLAALNKVDRLKPGELALVQRALREAMPELSRDPIPVSARLALRARLVGAPDEALAESGFPELLAALEGEVFSRSRALKRRACGGRLLALLEETLAGEPAAVGALLDAGRSARAEGEALGRLEAGLAEDVEAAVAVLEAGQGEAFEDAAREVLAFVRPRTNRFSTHGADAEDRAFLQETIQARLEGVGEAAATTLLDAAGRRIGAVLPAGRSGELALRVRAAIAPPIAAFAGYQAGLLAGGGLRRFFDEVLPHAELALTPLVEALSALRAHPREALKPALEAALSALVRALREEAAHAATQASADELALRARRYEPLRVLLAVLEELVDGPGGARG